MLYWLSKLLFSDYLFLIPLLAIAAIAAWEDFEYGKIRNKWIKIGFLWGLAIFALFILWNLSFWTLEYFNIAPHSAFILRLSYLREVFLNSGLALLVGFLMWRWNVWSAGDAKLFVLFSLLLPLKFYSKTYLAYFPSFALLLNIFTIALVFFLIRLVYTFFQWLFFLRREDSLKKKEDIKKNGAKKKASNLIKEALAMIVIFFVIVSIFGILFRSTAGKTLTYFFTVTLGLEKWTVFIILLGVFILLMRFLQKIRKVFYFIAIILLAFLLYKWISFSESPLLAIKPMVGATSIIIFGGFAFRKMFDWYLKKKEIKPVSPEELKEGMRLTEETINALREKGKISFEKAIGRIYPEGLTKEQVPLLKEFIKDKKIKLEVYKPSPFAIWMLIGLIITIILKAAVIQPLLR